MFRSSVVLTWLCFYREYLYLCYCFFKGHIFKPVISDGMFKHFGKAAVTNITEFSKKA